MSYVPPSGGAVNLTFSGLYSPPSGGAIELNFSDSVAGGAAFAASVLLDDVAAEGNFYFKAYAFHFGVNQPLDDVGEDLTAVWSAGVFRGLTASRKSGFTGSNTVDTILNFPSAQSIKVHPMLNSSWDKSQNISSATVSSWDSTPTISDSRKSAWQQATLSGKAYAALHKSPAQKSTPRGAGWARAANFCLFLSDSYRSPVRKLLASAVLFAKNECLTATYLNGYGVATHIFRTNFTVPWQVANPHSWIFGGWITPPAPVLPPYVPSPELVFYQLKLDYPGGAILEFNKPCWAWPLETFTVTILKGVTIVNHSISVVRLPDLANIQTLSVSIQFDIDSWAWSVSLELKTAQALALVESATGEPVPVRINIDGNYFTAIIEEVNKSERFGEKSYTATGRSSLALLSSRYAPVRSYTETTAKTAGQLIDYELLNTGISASIDSDLLQLFSVDWLVPAGAWSYQSKSPIDAITEIAKSVGARAFADKANDLIHIKPRYKSNPWDWAYATPDKSLPLGLVDQINTRLQPKPAYNQIYVSGQNQGVIVSAIRQGTAGDKPAPMITDMLITHVAAGTERARNELSNTGRQSGVSFDLPVNPTTGIIEPGHLVEVQDTIPWRGLATSLNISATLGSVRQIVEIERHYS